MTNAFDVYREPNQVKPHKYFIPDYETDNINPYYWYPNQILEKVIPVSTGGFAVLFKVYYEYRKKEWTRMIQAFDSEYHYSGWPFKVHDGGQQLVQETICNLWIDSISVRNSNTCGPNSTPNEQYCRVPGQFCSRKTKKCGYGPPDMTEGSSYESDDEPLPEGEPSHSLSDREKYYPYFSWNQIDPKCYIDLFRDIDQNWNGIDTLDNIDSHTAGFEEIDTGKFVVTYQKYYTDEDFCGPKEYIDWMGQTSDPQIDNPIEFNTFTYPQWRVKKKGVFAKIFNLNSLSYIKEIVFTPTNPVKYSHNLVNNIEEEILLVEGDQSVGTIKVEPSLNVSNGEYYTLEFVSGDGDKNNSCFIIQNVSQIVAYPGYDAKIVWNPDECKNHYLRNNQEINKSDNYNTDTGGNCKCPNGETVEVALKKYDDNGLFQDDSCSTLTCNDIKINCIGGIPEFIDKNKETYNQKTGICGPEVKYQTQIDLAIRIRAKNMRNIKSEKFFSIPIQNMINPPSVLSQGAGKIPAIYNKTTITKFYKPTMIELDDKTFRMVYFGESLKDGKSNFVFYVHRFTEDYQPLTDYKPNVESKTSEYWPYGGYCLCPSGEQYPVSVENMNCSQLQWGNLCENGIVAECNMFEGKWSGGLKVKCGSRVGDFKEVFSWKDVDSVIFSIFYFFGFLIFFLFGTLFLY